MWIMILIKESQIDGVAPCCLGCVMRSAVIVVFGGKERKKDYKRGNERWRDEEREREREARILLCYTFFMNWSIHQEVLAGESLSYSSACLFPEVN